MSTASDSLDARPRVRALWPLSLADKIVIASFIVVPFLIYWLPALTGHLIAPGDDLNQNLPLRILSGEFLRAGKIPAWNPSIWSGTPLLGGWNAGALFPGTFLFVFLPISLAWPINLALAPALAATGVYLLLRRFTISELPAAFAGAIFAYTGFMAGQVVHVGLTQGTAFTPWILLALDVFLRPLEDHAPRGGRFGAVREPRSWWWIIILALAISGTVLAGDPRAISTGAVAAAIYLVAMLTRPNAQRSSGLVLIAFATVLGTLLASAQLLPGLSFLHASQRDTTPLSFFATGSVSIRSLFVLFVAPFSLGANGLFGMPDYIGGYNLPELTLGTGYIALMAACAYIPDTLKAFFSRFRPLQQDRTLDPRKQLGVWYAFVIIGAVLALGTNLPTGRLLVHIPFYGNERLQNRNIALADLGLAVFAGFFVDEVTRAIREQRWKSFGLRRGLARLFALVPLVIALVTIVIELNNPVGFQRYMNVPGIVPNLNQQLLGYLIPSLTVIVVLIIFLVVRDAASPRWGQRLLVVVAVFDLGIFLFNASYDAAPTSLFTSPTPLSTQVKHLLGGQGRFVLYDPFYVLTSPHRAIAQDVGLPDLNVLQGNPSVQGYGSIVNGVYQRVTGSHLLNSLNPAILRGTTANTLDLRVLLSPSAYLENSLSAGEKIPVPPANLVRTPGVPHLFTGPWTLKPTSSMDWQLTTPRLLRRATFVVAKTSVSDARITVDLFNGANLVEQRVLRPRKSQVAIGLDETIPVTSIRVVNTTGAPFEVLTTMVTTVHPGQRLVLNGSLQGFLPSGHWVYDGKVGPLTAFKNTEIHGLAWLQPPTTHTPNTKAATQGKVTVTRGSVTSEQVMHVHTAAPAILVRSEAYASGWSVSITPIAGGTPTTQVVHRFGLIQEVTLPKGDWTVVWHYRPRTMILGIAASIVGLIIALGLAAILLIDRRRRIARDTPSVP